MKKLFIPAYLILTFLIPVKVLLSNTLIIDAKTFAAELKTNKNMIVIDVQAADVYAKQHIQGAINIPHKSLYKEGPIEGQFKDAAELAVIFGKKGVSNSSKIVIYDDGSQKYNSRIWWVLKYLGASDVSLLHKEMSQMEAARIPMTTMAKTLPATTFEVAVNPEMNIEMAAVKSLSGNPDAIILDNREKDEFDGMDKDKRSKGHLPGAVFMNFKEVLTSTGAYKTKEEIIAAVSRFGVTPDKQIVVYCQTGIKAAVVYIALKEIAGFSNVKLYAGAYTEWASVADNQIVK
jgi:thiosulfate/3-mercaptopyruvate sulfurtransferase